MSNDQKQNRGPSHIAYQVREGEENKSYFNRIGAVWPHKDGQGYNIQLDSVPIDGRITVRTVEDRLQEAKDKAQDDRGTDRREASSRDERRSASREDRAPRDGGPRYER